MRRQRNMAQMKEHNKNQKKKKGDKQFVRCRVQNTGYQDAPGTLGYLNSIKKTQAEIKVTLSEMTRKSTGNQQWRG